MSCYVKELSIWPRIVRICGALDSLDQILFISVYIISQLIIVLGRVGLFWGHFNEKQFKNLKFLAVDFTGYWLDMSGSGMEWIEVPVLVKAR